MCRESSYYELVAEYDDSHQIKACWKFTVSSFKEKKHTQKTDVSAAYSENARLEMSGESVTDILKLISQPGLLALATAFLLD